MMQLGEPVNYMTVRALLSELQEADAEIGRVHSDRDHWQEAYCEARLEARDGTVGSAERLGRIDST